MPKEKPAVQFNRVSSADQRDGFSLEAQRSMGEKYAKEHGLKVVRPWSVGESASKETDRKHFFEMIEFVKNNNIKDVIFDKIDRACRGFQSAQVVDELIQSHRVRFHFTRDRLVVDENSQPQEKLRFYFGTVLGKYYIDNLKTEINKGLCQRREAGLWNSKAPFGYKNIRIDASKKAVVVVDEVAGPLARELFELYSTGNYGSEQLCGLIKKRFPERTVSKRIVEEMLANPFYYGAMKHKGKVLKGSHEPLIDKKLWDACQRIRGLRSANYRNVGNNCESKPFMVMMVCGECGHAITGETKKKTSGKVYIYYRCANLRCPQKSKVTPQATILMQLQTAFEPFTSPTPKIVADFIDALQGRLEDFELFIQQQVGERATQLMSIKESIAKLEKMKSDGTLTDADYSEVRRIQEELTRESKAGNNDEDVAGFQGDKYRILIAKLIKQIERFMYKDDFLLEKARLAKLVLTNLRLTNGVLEYSYQKPFDVFAGCVKNRDQVTANFTRCESYACHV